ncbi:MAG: KEOPS complex subunit Cgi121 [Candidatus Caldarchaeum sp.]
MRLLQFRNKYVAAGVIPLADTNVSELLDSVLKNFKNVQLVDASKVMDWDVFDAAVVNAVLAFGTPKQKAKTIANEILIRLAATTQVDEAIKKLGLTPNSKEAVFYVVGDDSESVVDTVHKLLQFTKTSEKELLTDVEINELQQSYGLTDEQIAAVQAQTRRDAVKLLVIQKIASSMV